MNIFQGGLSIKCGGVAQHKGLSIRSRRMGRKGGLSIGCRYTWVPIVHKGAGGHRKLSIRNMGRRHERLFQLLFFKWRILQGSVLSTYKERERERERGDRQPELGETSMLRSKEEASILLGGGGVGPSLPDTERPEGFLADETSGEEEPVAVGDGLKETARVGEEMGVPCR